MDAYTDCMYTDCQRTSKTERESSNTESAAKNAYLPILAGVLLSSSRVVLKNVPQFSLS